MGLLISQMKFVTEGHKNVMSSLETLVLDEKNTVTCIVKNFY